MQQHAMGGIVMHRLHQPFRRGELVTLRDAPAEPMGRIVSVTEDGQQAEIAWHKFPGHDNEVTTEPTAALRRVHESEMESDSD
jgi:hypothetical protein